MLIPRTLIWPVKRQEVSAALRGGQQGSSAAVHSCTSQRDDRAWRWSQAVYNSDVLDFEEDFSAFLSRYLTFFKSSDLVNRRSWLQLVPDSGFCARTCSLCENVGWPSLRNRLVALALQGHNAGFVLA